MNHFSSSLHFLDEEINSTAKTRKIVSELKESGQQLADLIYAWKCYESLQDIRGPEDVKNIFSVIVTFFSSFIARRSIVVNVNEISPGIVIHNASSVCNVLILLVHSRMYSRHSIPHPLIFELGYSRIKGLNVIKLADNAPAKETLQEMNMYKKNFFGEEKDFSDLYLAKILVEQELNGELFLSGGVNNSEINISW